MQIRIGTRKSKLAIWQATYVLEQIHKLGLKAELVLIDSLGDVDKTSDIRAFNQTGIFTKALDSALLNREIELAIHSLKDYPTQPMDGISITSTGTRENPKDVLVKNLIEKNINASVFNIGTGSVRRKAQWKFKYPNSKFHPLRGNVPTRLEKLYDSDWDGVIMAYAGMKRLNLVNEQCTQLDWMIPAPSQGVLGLSFRSDDEFAFRLAKTLQDEDTQLCSNVERKFLSLLEGGCSAPIGALAVINGEEVKFKGSLHDPSGFSALFVEKAIPKSQALDAVSYWVEEILKDGGREIMDNIRTD